MAAYLIREVREFPGDIVVAKSAQEAVDQYVADHGDDTVDVHVYTLRSDVPRRFQVVTETKTTIRPVKP